ncbi:hypothetical protein E2C01_048517 [Portunus trituberculatus]|uniref:Uncharacterized protein n=1 Tax=Portunus trituberculatus TaxID=210409 RepID=A0A5B7GDM0_PORTR|nr:hypothetical protein [Portunus trituberculatus]
MVKTAPDHDGPPRRLHVYHDRPTLQTTAASVFFFTQDFLQETCRKMKYQQKSSKRVPFLQSLTVTQNEKASAPPLKAVDA